MNTYRDMLANPRDFIRRINDDWELAEEAHAIIDEEATITVNEAIGPNAYPPDWERMYERTVKRLHDTFIAHVNAAL